MKLDAHRIGTALALTGLTIAISIFFISSLFSSFTRFDAIWAWQSFLITISSYAGGWLFARIYNRLGK